MEIHALARRGWSVSAIARHTGRDRKTVRRYLRGERPTGGRAPSVLEPYRDYIAARFDDDPHLPATVLYEELWSLGVGRAYPTLVRELRRLELRPRCLACRAGSAVAAELVHEPGEELQRDWLELQQAPWGQKAYVLVGVLPFSIEAVCAASSRRGRRSPTWWRRSTVSCAASATRRAAGAPIG